MSGEKSRRNIRIRNEEEKNEILVLLQLLNPVDSNYKTLKAEFETIVLLDEF